MSDCDEGDVPYAGRYCACGLLDTPEARAVSAALGFSSEPACPECGLSWPANLEERSPYDGKPDVHRHLRLDVDVARVLGFPCDRSWAASSASSRSDIDAWLAAAPSEVRAAFAYAVAKQTADAGVVPDDLVPIVWCRALVEVDAWERANRRLAASAPA